MAKIKWLPEAIEDIDRLYKFLQSKDLQAAARAASCILEGASLLKTSPRIGRPMPDETGRHELFVAFGAGAYVLRYMLATNNSVVIIRVWHSRENRE
jgi:plasmid stabilization system protein ParE